jgi:hypothetical protein
VAGIPASRLLPASPNLIPLQIETVRGSYSAIRLPEMRRHGHGRDIDPAAHPRCRAEPAPERSGSASIPKTLQNMTLRNRTIAPFQFGEIPIPKTDDSGMKS